MPSCSVIFAMIFAILCTLVSGDCDKHQMCKDIVTRFALQTKLCFENRECFAPNPLHVVDCKKDQAFLLEYNCYAQGI